MSDAISRESNGHGYEMSDEFDNEYQDEPHCYDCGGRGEFVDCPDDLCHGQDECIHGDPPRICPSCKGRNLL